MKISPCLSKLLLAKVGALQSLGAGAIELALQAGARAPQISGSEGTRGTTKIYRGTLKTFPEIHVGNFCHFDLIPSYYGYGGPAAEMRQCHINNIHFYFLLLSAPVGRVGKT